VGINDNRRVCLPNLDYLKIIIIFKELSQVSRYQSRRHLYYLKTSLRLAGITLVTAIQVAAPSSAQVAGSSSTLPRIENTATYSYTVDLERDQTTGNLLVNPITGKAPTEKELQFQSSSNTIPINRPLGSDPLGTGGPIDPNGKITGCNGETLASYEGFTAGLYETPDSLRLGNLVSLTGTELPDLPNNNIPAGIEPNPQNTNPFALTVGNVTGKYNFLLDPAKGQVVPGRSYILVIKPPAGSIYTERQILLRIINFVGGNITINASSLNGQILDINAANPSNSVTITAPLDTIGTNLSLFGLAAGVCPAQTLQIVKSADRAAAEPGDTVVYRLLLKNLSTTGVNSIRVTDTLPLGFRLQPTAVKARLDNVDVPVTVTLNSNVATFTFPTIPTLDPSKTINVAYATTLTPESARGTGRNSALLTGIRTGIGGIITDGPATHQLQIRQGIVADTGTIIGRVFVDKNFDGEQQPNEPGIPNAVVFLDDGNKITTDANGLFSVKCAANGYRTGVLDLSSLPGYTLAPNLYFKERNSQSRLVKLAPSGLVRMNFGVTPTAREAK
jgi:uncharacterized repeat protein (TIGR01451 family)